MKSVFLNSCRLRDNPKYYLQKVKDVIVPYPLTSSYPSNLTILFNTYDENIESDHCYTFKLRINLDTVHNLFHIFIIFC